MQPLVRQKFTLQVGNWKGLVPRQTWSLAKARLSPCHATLQASLTHFPSNPIPNCHTLLQPTTCKLCSCCRHSTLCNPPQLLAPCHLQSNPPITSPLSCSRLAPFLATTTGVQASGGSLLQTGSLAHFPQ